MKRLGALVLSIALVGGAVLVSRAVWNNDAGGDTDPTDTTRPDGTVERLRVVCATEFAAACDRLQENPDVAGRATFRTEAPGTTADALAADPTPDFDLWLTSTPWPELATVRATRAPRIGAASRPLAQAQVSLVATKDRATDITATCGSPEASWQCVLRQNGRTLPDRAPVRFGVAPVDQTAGALAVGSFTQGFFPGQFDTLDVEVNDDFQSVFSSVKGSAVTDATPLRTMLLQPKFSVAADLGAAAQLDAAANGAGYRVLAPGAIARAVAVPAATSAGRSALERLGADNVRTALRAGGWSSPTSADDGLPDAGVLDSLLDDWSRK